jgi:hypothetical protein
MSDPQNPSPTPGGIPALAAAPVPPGEFYTSLMLAHLKSTRPWLLFIAILGIISCALLVIGGIILSAVGSLAAPAFGGAAAGTILVAYIVIAGLEVPAIVFLFRFASAISSLLETGKTHYMELALRYQKSYWKYIGSLIIVAIALGILAFIIVTAITVSAATAS